MNGDVGKIPYDFFSSHFYLLYNQKAKEENKTYEIIEELKKLNKEDIEKIFSSTDLRVESEDSLFEVITLLGEDFYFLFDFLEVQYLSVENMKQLIENINNYEIPFHSKLWSSLCRRLCLNCSSSSNPRQKTPIQCNDGVLRYIYDKTNRNVYLSNIIDVEVSGIDNGEIKNLFDKSRETSLTLKNSEESYIIIDLKEKKINLTKYYLSVPNNNKYYSNDRPKTWNVSGSNDKKEWDTLDVKSNDSYLNSYGSNHTYECQRKNKNYYRYIRFNNITSQNNNHRMELSEIELYGSILTK